MSSNWIEARDVALEDAGIDPYDPVEADLDDPDEDGDWPSDDDSGWAHWSPAVAERSL